MENDEQNIFLKPTVLKPQAEHGSEITRRFAMNKVGRMFAAALQDKSVRLYAAEDCTEMQRMQDEFLSTSLAFSPKGDIVATGTVERVVKLWDIRTAECIATLEGHTYPVLSLSFSPDGDKIVSGSGDTTLIIWDIENRSKIRQMKGHGFYVVTVDWDPQGSRVVSGSVDANICEWDVATGDMIARHDDHRAAVREVRFSPDGSRLVSGSSDLTLLLWNASYKPMKVEQILQAHESEVRALAFSTDGHYLASGSGDRTLYVWDMETLTVKGEASTMGEIDGIEWYPSRHSFLTADGTGAIIRWDVEDMLAMLKPFQDLLTEIEAANDPSRRDEFVEKFENLSAQHDEETLQTKRMFYVVWQCKRALGLLKGTTSK
ncbi:MAG: WD40 repeat domain-containing protein [Candidatus Thorarchaeota archaeon]|nr:WD40 repeat domain-containing protein [Candidatus Thorarchaeota archaeon]